MSGSKKDVVETTGIITEAHKGATFNVEVEMGSKVHTIVAKPSGKMARHKIKLVVGDEVNLEISTYDLTKGRITYRI